MFASTLTLSAPNLSLPSAPDHRPTRNSPLFAAFPKRVTPSLSAPCTLFLLSLTQERKLTALFSCACARFCEYRGYPNSSPDFSKPKLELISQSAHSPCEKAHPQAPRSSSCANLLLGYR